MILFSSDDEADETVPSPDNIDDGCIRIFKRKIILTFSLEIAPTILSELPKENFPSLQIEYKPFIQSIEQKITTGHQYNYIDLIGDYINELTKHSAALWLLYLSEKICYE